MAEPAPIRQRAKEWGEAADVWSKVAVRMGFLGIGVFSGSGVLGLLEKLVSG